MAKQKKNNYSDITSVPREAIPAAGARRLLSNCCSAGLNWLEPGRWTERQINKIAYVAVTRARQRLFIPYCFENNMIVRILGGL